MPRKYRPPASTRRRKTKTVEYDFPTPEPGAEAAVAEEGAAEEGDFEEEAAPVVQTRAQASRTEIERPERHVRRDYSYVRNDTIRIAIVGGGLLIAIIIAGFFR